MDRIINVMGFCHSYCRCSNDHICVQGNRNLKIRSSLIARRQIFLTVNYYSGKFLTAELDGCVCLTLLYSDTFTSDLRFPCAAFKGKSICCICTISKCKNRYYILCILFCILTVFFQTLAVLFWYSAVLNVGLGVFNLIPIPPLDGSHVLGELSGKAAELYNRYGRYWNLVLILLLVSGVLSRPLTIIDNAVLSGMQTVIFNLLSLLVHTGNAMSGVL